MRGTVWHQTRVTERNAMALCHAAERPVRWAAAVKLRKIKYSELNSKQKEAHNFQKVASALADYGFNCIELDDDWQGADFLAYHKDGKNTLKVQLKSRLTISKKYLGKSIYIAFPIAGTWYLILHDQLVGHLKRSTTCADPWDKRHGSRSRAARSTGCGSAIPALEQ